MPGFFCKKQASKFEKQAKHRSFNRKTSPKCVGKKIQQNKKSARKSGWPIHKNKPKMSKISRKHTQYGFSSKLKQQSAIKFGKNAICKTEIRKKQANFN